MATKKPARPKCRATTAKGKPCSKPAKKGGHLCGSHDGKAGRPRKYPTDFLMGADGPTVGSVICENVALGMPKVQVAKSVRLDVGTIQSWLDEGDADLCAGKDSQFSEFFRDYQKADADFTSDALKAMRRIGTAESKWQTFAWLLERRMPEDFGQRTAVDLSGEVNVVEQHAQQITDVMGALLADLDLTDGQLERLPALIEKHFGAVERQTT